MISYAVGTFVFGYLLGLIVGRSAYHKRSLARGGNIGTNPLILNEGRTIRSNGVDTASANRVPADCSSRIQKLLHMADIKLLQDYLELDPEVPSGLRWKRAASRSIAVGQKAGSRDPRGYYTVQLLGRSYKCHQLVLILNGILPPPECTEVDHIDRNRSNNLVSNLRWVTPSLNRKNCRVTGRVPYRYVRVHKSGRFEAQYKHPSTGKKIYVGLYTEAATAYREALVHRLEHHWL